MFNPQSGAWKPNHLAIAFVVCFAAAFSLTLQSDTYTFQKRPPDPLARLLTIPPAFSYRMSGDRPLSDAITLMVWLGLLFIVATSVWRCFYHYVFEPDRVRRFLQNRKRQEALLQDLEEK